MKIECIKYENQFQLGIAFTRHHHYDDSPVHFHFWIDMGRYCIELSWGRYKDES